MIAPKPDLHSMIEGLALKIDELRESAQTSAEVRAQLAALRADVDRLIEVEKQGKQKATTRLRLVIALAAALASLLGGTSEQWGPLVRAALAALGI